MPTYDYKCEACGHSFEEFQSMSAPPIKKCPKCKKNKVKRLIGAGAGLIFKGSGFYITDYRDSSYAEKAKADSGSSGDSGKSGSESKGNDTKPAAETKPAGESKPAETSTASKSPPAESTSKPSSSAAKASPKKSSGK